MKTISMLKNETADLFAKAEGGEVAYHVGQDFADRINPYFFEKYGADTVAWPINQETIAWAVVSSAFTGDPCCGKSFLETNNGPLVENGTVEITSFNFEQTE